MRYKYAQVIIGIAYRLNPGQLPQIITKDRHLFLCARCIELENQFLIFIKAKILIVDIIKLTINNDNTAYQYDRQPKLEHHQRTAYTTCRNTAGSIALYYFYDLKSRQIKSRITACHQTGYNNQTSQYEPYPVIA